MARKLWACWLADLRIRLLLLDCLIHAALGQQRSQPVIEVQIFLVLEWIVRNQVEPGESEHHASSQKDSHQRTPATRSRSRYSTVTDFARLRGWSTSVPMKTAVK